MSKFVESAISATRGRRDKTAGVFFRLRADEGKWQYSPPSTHFAAHRRPSARARCATVCVAFLHSTVSRVGAAHLRCPPHRGTVLGMAPSGQDRSDTCTPVLISERYCRTLPPRARARCERNGRERVHRQTHIGTRRGAKVPRRELEFYHPHPLCADGRRFIIPSRLAVAVGGICCTIKNRDDKNSRPSGLVPDGREQEI